MKPVPLVVPALLLLAGALTARADAPRAKLPYPAAERSAVIDHYAGTDVPAPYRWMEDLNSPAVAKWVQEENRLTFAWLDKVAVRDRIKTRLTRLWNYEKVGVPQREGGKLFFSRNSGLQNQSVIYRQASASAAPSVVIDPNALSPDGSVALLDHQPSRDGRYLAYALSQGGSDWETLHVRDIASGKDLADEVQWVKFSGIAWTNDNHGFFYSRFPAPPKGEAISDRVENQALWYHVLGTPQSADRKIYARPDLPEWIVIGSVSEDGRYLLVFLVNGTSTKNELFYADLGDPAHPDTGAKIEPLFATDDAEYSPIGNVGDTLFVQTSLDAPKRRIVSFKLADPAPAHWRTVVPESGDVIESALMAGGDVAVQYLVDAKSEVKLFATDGTPKGSLSLPGIGSVVGLSGRNDTPELFYGFTSYLYPTTIYRYDVANRRTSEFAKPKVAFDPSKYETRQVFYPSRDGTRVPMFITARKGLKLDGSHPTILYSYGGFNINITPSFSPMLPVWLEMGGIYAVANLRGGGEYGEAWHKAGMLGHKQNVFDDFAWAAKFLIREKYTSTPHLGIQGYSNGGLLVGASITEQPELFGAAYAGAGVMDMLRYQKFSGGALWGPEYGTSDDPEAFKWLRAYSPVQNVKSGTCYPPTMITTADHDDRVVPSHSYKFAAALQHAQSCANPILIRIETRTSHGYMPTDKRIAQTADVWAFMAHELGIEAAAAKN
ncbi:MAG TPA: prolyl oligopeptidase family serine peptidase [Rhodanobacteraceae bacterium]|nr:prolyl oligopeptidase family serine peptidase [Rhodanobacteraceae bacterium]